MVHPAQNSVSEDGQFLVDELIFLKEGEKESTILE